MRIRYVSRRDLEVVAYQLARELFEPWLGPMPALTVLGGPQGSGVLNGILALPKQSAGRKPAYPTIYDKAAVLFRSLIQDHPFVDGNKRMAVAATLLFLFLNRRVVGATDGELVNLALRTATPERPIDWEYVSRWLERRTVSGAQIVEAVEQGRVDELVRALPGRASLLKRGLLAMMAGLAAMVMEDAPAE